MPDRQDALREALKRAAAALKRDGPNFALAGSYALWAHGAPEPIHDVDIAVAEQDVDDAAAVLTRDGFEIERTPEDWLVKAHLDGVVVDILHRLNGEPIKRELLAHADEHEVLAIRMPVLRPTDLVIVKLRSLTEHYCDFATLLPTVRAIREQLDWPRIRKATAENDYAAAFLFLTQRLGISG